MFRSSLEKNKILAVRSSKRAEESFKGSDASDKRPSDSVQIHKSKLNYIAASIGPGSFTGIRIEWLQLGLWLRFWIFRR